MWTEEKAPTDWTTNIVPIYKNKGNKLVSQLERNIIIIHSIQYTSPSAIQVKNWRQTIGIEEKLDVISCLEKGDQIVDILC